ncbi:MAG TPA: MGMT family protein [Jatrophihabitantaceae bacterium]|nr:MGMT family protein [Jatrophihabitantaceae bacterium]
MNDELAQRILTCVEAIPAGRVMSYGDVAEYAGARTPRLVGHVLRHDGGSVPWHRVLHADGTFADHLRDEQRQRLIAEGVRVTDGRVDLRVYRWDGKSS